LPSPRKKIARSRRSETEGPGTHIAWDQRPHRETAAGVRGQKISEIGEKVKYASAHDLRRAFGERWAALIMPAHLQQLMRHQSIETTLRYYVGANAERTAETCWAAIPGARDSYAGAFGEYHNGFHNTPPAAVHSEPQKQTRARSSGG
jgi:integrase